MALVVYQNCEKLMEIDESPKSTSRDLMKMNQNILHFINVGLPNLDESHRKFIGKKILYEIVAQHHELWFIKLSRGNHSRNNCKLHQTTTTMNAVIDEVTTIYVQPQ